MSVYLQRHHDAAGTLLYIAVSWSSHGVTSGAWPNPELWFDYVDLSRSTYDEIADRSTANRTRRAAVAAEAPIFNLAGASDPKYGRPVRYLIDRGNWAGAVRLLTLADSRHLSDRAHHRAPSETVLPALLGPVVTEDERRRLVVLLGQYRAEMEGQLAKPRVPSATTPRRWRAAVQADRLLKATLWFYLPELSRHPVEGDDPLLVSWSLRDAAEHYGKTESTVFRWIRQAIETGYLTVEREAVGPKPPVYRLTIPGDSR